MILPISRRIATYCDAESSRKKHAAVSKDEEPGFDERAFSLRFAAGSTRQIGVVERPIAPLLYAVAVPVATIHVTKLLPQVVWFGF